MIVRNMKLCVATPVVILVVVVTTMVMVAATEGAALALPARNDADYEYNTEANHNKPQPSPITPGIQPSTVYAIRALPPDPEPPSHPYPPLASTTATSSTPPLHFGVVGGSPPSVDDDYIYYQDPTAHLGVDDEDDYYASSIETTSNNTSSSGSSSSSTTTTTTTKTNDSSNDSSRNAIDRSRWYTVKEILEGSVLRLKCKLVGLQDNEPVIVSWYHNDTELTELTHPRIKFPAYKTPPRLRISPVRHSDAGVYSGYWRTPAASQSGWCNTTVVVLPPPHHPQPVEEEVEAYLAPLPLQARSKIYDEDVADDPITEDVQDVPLAPVFTRKMQGILVKPAGNVAELRCPTRGAGEITTRWEKDGRPPQRKIGEVRIRKNMLKMENLVPFDSGNYTCIASNEYGSVNHTFNVDVIERLASRPILKQNLVNQTVTLGTDATLECSVISDQPPFISWLKHPTEDGALDSDGSVNHSYVIKEGGHLDTTEDPQVLVLTNVTSADQGWYTCLAANSIGTSYSTAYLSVVPESTPPLVTHRTGLGASSLFIVVVVLVLLMALCCVFTSCFLCKWRQAKRRSKQLERSSEGHYVQPIKKVIVERQSSENSNEPLLLVPHIKIEHGPSRLCLSGAPSSSSGGSSSGGSNSSSLCEYELPVDEDWELSRERLVLSESLGEGAFGKVLKAELLPDDACKAAETVAVKMLKEAHTDGELMDLVSEMEMMKLIGTHQNIINLVGCCTQDGPLYVVVEYAHYGNLRDYLRSSYTSSSLLGYECAIGQEPPKCALTQRDLLGFAYQVARGMDYLAAKKCVHRDLAARNVLVCYDRILKIADFGLARDVHSQDYYRKTSKGRLPVKWMAPEALFKSVYTSKSDVWSFGILLWEIMSLGGSPYPTVAAQNLFKLLSDGHRMLKPHHCSTETYVLMKDCWRYNAADRPTFRDILNELSRQLSMVTNEEYLELSVSSHHLDTPPSSYESGVTSHMLPQHL